MFVTPMISVLPSDLYNCPRRYSVNKRAEANSRLSTTSSDASSLHRTSSTTSHASTSSSVSSPDTKKTQHRRTISGSSFRLPKAFQPFHKKVRSQSHSQPTSEPRQRLPPPPSPPQQRPRQPPPRPRRPSQEALQSKEPLVTLSPKRPVTLPAAPSFATQWQCSDLVVRCKTDMYHVDRTIMCYHSKWFARICAIMKTPKASKSVIDLSADDPDAVAAMMQYCYQLNYTDPSTDSNSVIDEVADLRPHVDIYMLAERYGVAGLKQLALEKFEALATTVLSMSGNERILLRAVRAIYEPSRRANADELRRVVIAICANHVQGFISGSNTTMALVFESMDELPEFRADLFEEMALRWK
ncbi:hypothetical protein HBI81_192550 [Parastagonospora nodorum]|nr:hypothetical protein HBI09_187370 [Parastagonospora nodorum]KAH4994508.1 hypothetical protein HBI77_208540 [Parastagonospora nodorum]KAH6516301.1 hypothetical protein HBI81_192550 [Parastagonospora nodorum]